MQLESNLIYYSTRLISMTKYLGGCNLNHLTIS